MVNGFTELSHRHILIKNNIIENNSPKNIWIHAYDCQESDSGIIEWTVKILKEGETGAIKWNHWTIGVIDSSALPEEGFYFAGYTSGNRSGYGYNSSGDFYHGSSDAYGPRYGVGDTITTVADFDKLFVSFRLNGKELGTVKERLKDDTKYRFVVTSYCNGDSLTFLESRVSDHQP